MKTLFEKLTALINTITVDSTKATVDTINESIIKSINSKLIELSVQKVCPDKNAVDSLKESIKNVDMKDINNLVNSVNCYYESHLIDLILNKSSIKSLMTEKSFKCPALNNSIPLINLYKHIEACNKASGFIVTMKSKPYGLTMLFPDDNVIRSNVRKLSYDFSDDAESLNDAISKANAFVSKSTDNINISLRTNFYKNCIGEHSSKYYKGVLDSLVDYISDKIDDSGIKGKRFNSVCMEWIASKVCRDSKLCEFKAFKTFNADTTLYNYVKSALYCPNNFGQLH